MSPCLFLAAAYSTWLGSAISKLFSFHMVKCPLSTCLFFFSGDTCRIKGSTFFQVSQYHLPQKIQFMDAISQCQFMASRYIVVLGFLWSSVNLSHQKWQPMIPSASNILAAVHIDCVFAGCGWMKGVKVQTLSFQKHISSPQRWIAIFLWALPQFSL